jgi:L-2-hydroxyglutarate oxidase LhgO
VIGAGLAGITAGALLPAKVPGIQLTIFEKNPEVVCYSSYLDVSSIARSSSSPRLGTQAKRAINANGG